MATHHDVILGCFPLHSSHSSHSSFFILFFASSSRSLLCVLCLLLHHVDLIAQCRREKEPRSMIESSSFFFLFESSFSIPKYFHSFFFCFSFLLSLSFFRLLSLPLAGLLPFTKTPTTIYLPSSFIPICSQVFSTSSSSSSFPTLFFVIFVIH